jgi:hypothetical protein
MAARASASPRAQQSRSISAPIPRSRIPTSRQIAAPARCRHGPASSTSSSRTCRSTSSASASPISRRRSFVPDQHAYVRRVLTGASVNSDMLDASGNTPRLLQCRWRQPDHTKPDQRYSHRKHGSRLHRRSVFTRRRAATFWSFDDASVYVYDGATGVLKQTLGAHSSTGLLFCAPDEISISGVTYAIFWSDFNGQCLANSGSGWSLLWNQYQGLLPHHWRTRFRLGRTTSTMCPPLAN